MGFCFSTNPSYVTAGMADLRQTPSGIADIWILPAGLARGLSTVFVDMPGLSTIFVLNKTLASWAVGYMAEKKKASGCLGCVGLLTLLGCGGVIGLIAMASINGPRKDGRPRETQPAVEPFAIEKKWPYQFVKSKTEQTAHKNAMDLYAFSGALDPADLKAFCRERKQLSPAKVFYYVVIFDNPGNAKFPSSPFTAEYGIEQDALKHIRAIYVYNKLNGFSELRYYDRNAWESKAKYEEI